MWVKLILCTRKEEIPSARLAPNVVLEPTIPRLRGGKGRGGEERNADTGGMVQPSQQHVAPCVKGVGRGLGTRG